MKKILIVMIVPLFLNIFPHAYTSTYELNAGVIKWGVKKIIKGSIKIIFSSVKDSIVEYNKQKLVKYLKKHPEYINYSINVIKRHINGNPKYIAKGNKLLEYIKLHTKNYIGNR